jgi:hypothetical protein
MNMKFMLLVVVGVSEILFKNSLSMHSGFASIDISHTNRRSWVLLKSFQSTLQRLWNWWEAWGRGWQ